jgi:hypothetical protein
MAHFLPSGYKVLWRIRASRYRAVKELVNYPGAVKFITGSGAVRVCQAVLSCLGSRNKSKKCDKRLTHIVRVSISGQNLNPVIGNQIFLCLSLILHPFNLIFGAYLTCPLHSLYAEFVLLYYCHYTQLLSVL